MPDIARHGCSHTAPRAWNTDAARGATASGRTQEARTVNRRKAWDTPVLFSVSLEGMTFSALHRELGLPPGPFTIDMIDQVVAEGLIETADLDWKRALIPIAHLSKNDFPKDVAAMANGSGGVIVFGVEEQKSAAAERKNMLVEVEDEEKYLRALIKTTVTHIHPPVFGVHSEFVRDDNGEGVLIVHVPSSPGRPHLVYNNDYFGCPIRTGPDTKWLAEPELARLYRERFNEQRFADDALDELYDQAAAHRRDNRVWFVGVARPRVQSVTSGRVTQEDMLIRHIGAQDLAKTFKTQDLAGPLNNVSGGSSRQGLRSRVLVTDTTPSWAGAFELFTWVTLYDDGSVTVAQSVGNVPVNEDKFTSPTDVPAWLVESSVADLVSLIVTQGSAAGASDYDLRVGLESDGEFQFWVQRHRGFRTMERSPYPTAQFVKLSMTLDLDQPEDELLQTVRQLALDCVAQGGVELLTEIKRPKPSVAS